MVEYLCVFLHVFLWFSQRVRKIRQVLSKATLKAIKVRMRNRPRSKRNVLLSFFLTAVGFVVIIAAIWLIGEALEKREYREERAQMSENFGQLPTKTVDGKVYIRRPEVETMLIIGVDKRPDDPRTGYRDGGQADFLMVLAIDHAKRQIHQLQIDRDTMTDITMVGVLGNVTGTRVLQICLSHGFGATPEQSCNFAVTAVEHFLQDEPMELYMTLQLDAISVLNDLVGGVTVTIPEDYTSVDPTMVKGATMTLTDEQVELLVRSRMSVGDGTNSARSQRQRVFLKAAAEQLKARLNANLDFANSLIDAIDRISSWTNIQHGRLINEVNRAYNYDILPAESIAGEYTLGSDGFVEFHADPDAVTTWLLKTLYEPK